MKKFNLKEFEKKMKMDLMKENLDREIREAKERKLKRLKELDDENKSEYCS